MFCILTPAWVSDFQFNEHIFQRGWFNHHLGTFERCVNFAEHLAFPPGHIWLAEGHKFISHEVCFHLLFFCCFRNLIIHVEIEMQQALILQAAGPLTFSANLNLLADASWINRSRNRCEPPSATAKHLDILHCLVSFCCPTRGTSLKSISYHRGEVPHSCTLVA